MTTESHLVPELPVAIFLIDSAGTMHNANQAGLLLFNLRSLDETENHSFQSYLDPLSQQMFQHHLGELFGGHDAVECELICNSSTGDHLQVMMRSQLLPGLDFAFILLFDLPQQVETAQFYDEGHTQLPNRKLLQNLLDQAVKKARKNRRRFALLLCDIDRFKHINDSLGHNMGDELLAQVSQRLLGNLRQEDILIRLGGDEFALIINGIEKKNIATQVANRILTLMEGEYVLAGQQVYVSMSIGIALYPQHSQDMETLLRQADLAMYHAKASGRNNYQFYNSSMGEQADEYIRMSVTLRNALEEGHFSLVFEPQIDSLTGTIVSVESLCRWNDGGRMISPGQFIPFAERTGLIIPLGQWVLDEACRQAAHFMNTLDTPIPVAVNVSTRQFKEDDLVARVREALKRHNLDGRYLEIEITESLFIQDHTQILNILNGLKELGVKIVLDDFGVGYSALSYLHQFPIDKLKIDRSFVRDIGINEVYTVITETIIAMANALDIQVVAEGVETESQRDFLIQRHCGLMQGFLFTRPLHADKVVDFLKRYNEDLS